MNEIIKRLTALISWSDRLGSDEIIEIREIINDLKKIKNDRQ